MSMILSKLAFYLIAFIFTSSIFLLSSSKVIAFGGSIVYRGTYNDTDCGNRPGVSATIVTQHSDGSWPKMCFNTNTNDPNGGKIYYKNLNVTGDENGWSEVFWAPGDNTVRGGSGTNGDDWLNWTPPTGKAPGIYRFAIYGSDITLGRLATIDVTFMRAQDRSNGSSCIFRYLVNGVEQDQPGIKIYTSIPGNPIPITLHIRIKMRNGNTNRETWLPTEGYKLVANSPNDSAYWGYYTDGTSANSGSRPINIPITSPINYGTEAIFDFDVTTPYQPGNYQIPMQMMVGDSRFGAECKQKIEVWSGNETTEPSDCNLTGGDWSVLGYNWIGYKMRMYACVNDWAIPNSTTAGKGYIERLSITNYNDYKSGSGYNGAISYSITRGQCSTSSAFTRGITTPSCSGTVTPGPQFNTTLGLSAGETQVFFNDLTGQTDFSQNMLQEIVQSPNNLYCGGAWVYLANPLGSSNNRTPTTPDIRGRTDLVNSVDPIGFTRSTISCIIPNIIKVSKVDGTENPLNIQSGDIIILYADTNFADPTGDTILSSTINLTDVNLNDVPIAYNRIAKQSNGIFQITMPAKSAGQYQLTIRNPTGIKNPSAQNKTITYGGGGGRTVRVDCSADKTSVNTGQDVVWTPIISAGTFPFTYAWTFGANSTCVNPTTGCASNDNPTVSYSSTGVKNATLLVTDSTEGDSGIINCSNSVTVTGGGSQPDLVIDSLLPTSAVSGSSVSFSGRVLNQGGTSAVASSTRLRFASLAGGALDTTPANQSTGVLAAGGSQNATWASSWTATGVGNHQFEICADTPANAVAESNASGTGETNNCTIGNINVTATPVFDFSLSSPANITLTQNGSARTNTFTVNKIGTATSETVAFSIDPATPLPAGTGSGSGATYSFTPLTRCDPGTNPDCSGSNTLTITPNTAVTAPGGISVRIRGVSSPSSITRYSTPFTLIINPQPGGLTPPWIKTEGGDVHSNTKINTPGGP